MKDKDKTKQQLTRALAEARCRIVQLEALENERQIIPSVHQIEPFYPKR